MFLGSFKDVSKKLKGCFNDFFKVVSKVFQERLKNVFRSIKSV